MKQKLLFALLAMVLLIACNQPEKLKHQSIILNNTPGGSDIPVTDSTTVNAMISDLETMAPPPLPTQEPPKTNQQKEKQQQKQRQPESKPDWNKKIIKTADINIETKKYAHFSKKVSDVAVRFGGYIAAEQQTETDYKIENVITLKVPVDQFQSAIDFFATGDDKINEKKITSEDVTSQYVDTRSRLEAKRVARLRYLELLKQSKNMEEILQVQNEIDQIQEEIESAAGRINYLINASAMSTIHLTYYQVLNTSAKEDENPGFFRQIGTAFETGWKRAGDVLVGLIYLWPLLLLVAGILWYFKRTASAKKKNAVVAEA